MTLNFRAKHPYQERTTYYTYIGRMPYYTDKGEDVGVAAHLVNTDDEFTVTLESILGIDLEKQIEAYRWFYGNRQM